MTDTHLEKLKELELQTLKTQWPMCKAERLVDPSTNKLTEVDGSSKIRRGAYQQMGSHTGHLAGQSVGRYTG